MRDDNAASQHESYALGACNPLSYALWLPDTIWRESSRRTLPAYPHSPAWSGIGRRQDAHSLSAEVSAS
jgi:hypothetical protein